MDSNLIFTKIQKKDMPLIFRYLRQVEGRTCDYSYGGLLMWVDYFNYEYAIADDTLFIKGASPVGNGEIFYLPIGKMPPRASLRALSEYCREVGAPVTLMLQTDELQKVLSVCSDAKIMDIPDWRDYIYDIHDLSTYRGNRMKKKRNHYNAFTTAYPDFEVEEITDSNLAELHEFAARHAAAHSDNQMEAYENRATVRVVDDYRSYPFDGILIRIDGRIAGFSIGEVKGDTLYTHIEKGDISYRGIYQAVCLHFCRMIESRYPDVRFVNREDDAGDPNLRKSKLSYSPIGYVDKCLVDVSPCRCTTEKNC